MAKQPIAVAIEHRSVASASALPRTSPPVAATPLPTVATQTAPCPVHFRNGPAAHF